MGKTLVGIVGKKFGRLTAIQEIAERQNGCVRYLCSCDCGQTAIVRSHWLFHGKTQSCGCLHQERVGDKFRTHGLSKTWLYQRWAAMMARCYRKTYPFYSNYGGRGIRVCKRWHDPVKFIRDNEEISKQELTIERKNNNGHYSPSNTTWIRKERQSNNRRISRFITLNGRTMTMVDWDTALGLNGNLRSRLHRGWSIEKALTTPLRR